MRQYQAYFIEWSCVCSVVYINNWHTYILNYACVLCTYSCMSELAPAFYITIGEYSALWGEREGVVLCIYRQHGSYVYIAGLLCIYAQCTIGYLFMHWQSG